MKRTLLPVAIVGPASLLLSGCVVATTSRSGGGGGFFFLLLPLLIFFLMARMFRGGSRRRVRSVGYQQPTYRHAAQQEPPVSPQMLRAELSVLADDVLRLEPHVAMNDAARDDYEAATHRYRVAQAAIEQADDQLDWVRVQRVVDEARYSMARARATLEGRRAPEPPAELQAPGPHGEPAIRLDDRRNPVYVGSAAPFRMGWFGAGTGLFGGLLLGSMLSDFDEW